MVKQHKNAYYGKPFQLFKDCDKDGVANVFDCQPRNKRKQDREFSDDIYAGVDLSKRRIERSNFVADERQANDNLTHIFSTAPKITTSKKVVSREIERYIKKE